MVDETAGSVDDVMREDVAVSGGTPATEGAAAPEEAAGPADDAVPPDEAVPERAPRVTHEAAIEGHADELASDVAAAETDGSIDEDGPPAPNEAPTPAQEASGPRTVGRLVADALRTAGVRYAFTVPGELFLGLLDGLREAGIRIIATRHEGGAAFMAEAHGNLTGRPAACLGTRAVGAANLAIGIHTARQDSSPMFALVGQVERGIAVTRRSRRSIRSRRSAGSPSGRPN